MKADINQQFKMFIAVGKIRITELLVKIICRPKITVIRDTKGRWIENMVYAKGHGDIQRRN